jgi:hypothetical protein
MALSGHARLIDECLLLGDERTLRVAFADFRLIPGRTPKNAIPDSFFERIGAGIRNDSQISIRT